MQRNNLGARLRPQTFSEMYVRYEMALFIELDTLKVRQNKETNFDNLFIFSSFCQKLCPPSIYFT